MYYHPFSNTNQNLPNGGKASLDQFFGGNLYSHGEPDEIITENFFS